MSKIFSVLVVMLSLVAGFGGGWVYQITIGKQANNSAVTKEASTLVKTSSDNKSSDSTKQILAECLTEVWGADKYAAIAANSNLATTEDNLASLKCYQ